MITLACSNEVLSEFFSLTRIEGIEDHHLQRRRFCYGTVSLLILYYLSYLWHYQSAAIVEGKESIALATGIDSKAKGKIGCFIVLSEWKEIDNEYHIVDVKSAKVDGKNIKEDTFYTLKDGKFVEVD